MGRLGERYEQIDTDRFEQAFCLQLLVVACFTAHAFLANPFSYLFSWQALIFFWDGVQRREGETGVLPFSAGHPR